jgi:PAS domain S-box-containing protein
VRQLASLQAWPLLLLLLVVAAVFSQDRYPLTYVMVCVLLLATWRLGMTGAALGVLGTLLISVGATLAGHGPFALMQTSLVERVLALQLFLAVCFYLSVPVAIQGARARALRDRLVQALASARSARAKYRRIADGAQDIIVQTDRERILYVSPSCRRLGYAPAELVGRTIAELAHPDDLERVEALRARFFEAPQEIAPSDWRLRIRTASGAYRWLEGTPNLLRGRRGEAVAIETILRDVTESLAAEEALAASEARYRLLADHLTDMAACYGDDGVVRFVSPAVKALLGYEPEALVGRQIAELVHPEDVARCGAEFARHRSGADAGPFKIEYRMFRADGSVAWLEAHPRPTFDPDTGAFVEWVDVVRDIGERKTLEAELRAARAEAEASAQAKSDFLANMSHELRTPLTSVIGFGKLAEAAAGLEGPVRTYVERMSQASTSLLALVNDILDFSKLEAGDVTFRPRPVDVSELVRASFDLFEAQAEQKGLTLTLEGRWPAGLRLDLDPDRLRQVLLNLIGNAVKFTQAGGVTVTPRYDPDAGALTVEVRDTGPGITAEGQARLFQRFSQVDGSQTRQYGGTGLGLAICKGIVEAMGGRISVASRPGRGSAFAFTVPAAPAQDQPAGSALRGGDRIRLLLADDHADIRELVVLLLGDRVEVTAVEDGEAAVRVAARRRFDVMLLDQRMPRLDGPGVLARIRGASGPNRSTPALAFSAEGDAVGSRRIERMGFDGLVTKPVSAVELISAIAQALRDAPAPPAPGPAVPEPRDRRRSAHAC